MFKRKQIIVVVIAAIIFLIGVSDRIFTFIPDFRASDDINIETKFVDIEEPDAENVVMDAWVTAYSSTPEETDATPFITASGERVRDGIVATNFLSFNTRIQIPEFFGDKVFVVEDRMHRRKKGFIDIWMPTKELAQNFGIHFTEIIILDPDI